MVIAGAPPSSGWRSRPNRRRPSLALPPFLVAPFCKFAGSMERITRVRPRVIGREGLLDGASLGRRNSTRPGATTESTLSPLELDGVMIACCRPAGQGEGDGGGLFNYISNTKSYDKITLFCETKPLGA